MIEPIETPGDMAARLAGSLSVNDAGETLILAGIRADRRVIAEWCEEKATAADSEAQTHEMQLAQVPEGDTVTTASKRDRIARCEGQAVAWRGLAAILKR